MSPQLDSTAAGLINTYSGKAATPSSTPSNPTEISPTDPDLQYLNDAWPTLPQAIRAGILAMVEAAKQ